MPWTIMDAQAQHARLVGEGFTDQQIIAIALLALVEHLEEFAVRPILTENADEQHAQGISPRQGILAD